MNEVKLLRKNFGRGDQNFCKNCSFWNKMVRLDTVNEIKFEKCTQVWTCIQNFYNSSAEI